jgi:hypothetical protein
MDMLCDLCSPFMESLTLSTRYGSGPDLDASCALYEQSLTDQVGSRVSKY